MRYPATRYRPEMWRSFAGSVWAKGTSHWN